MFLSSLRDSGDERQITRSALDCESERHPQSDLPRSRRRDARNLAEGGRRDRGVRIAVLLPVEHVERLKAELKLRLAVQLELLRNSEVHTPAARSPHLRGVLVARPDRRPGSR